MRKTISPILMFLLSLLGGVTAWADFSETWTASPVGPWKQIAELPNGVTASLGTPYAYSQAVFNRTADANITITFTLTEGSQSLKVLGVRLASVQDETSYTDYTPQTVSDGTPQSFSFTGVAVGNYTLTYYVDNVTGTSEVASTSGNITVTGLEQGKFISSVSELSNDKVYVIKSGRTSGSNTYYLLYHEVAPNNLSSTYGSGHALEYTNTTTNFHFAIQNVGGKYYFYNMAGGKFVGNNSANNGAIPLGNVPTNDMKIRYNNSDPDYGEYCFLLSTNGTGALNCAETRGCHGVVNWSDGYNTTNDGGNRYQIIEIGDLSTDDKTAIQNKISWADDYKTAHDLCSQVSTTVVGAYTPTSCAELSNAVVDFYFTPNQDNYNTMMNAYNTLISTGTRVTLSAGKQFTIKCIEDSRGYIVYSTVAGKGSETTAYLASATGWSAFPALTAEGVNKAWAIYENNGTQYLYNVAKQRFIKPVTPVEFTDELYAVTLNQVEGETTQWTIKFPSNNKYLSSSPGWGDKAVRAESSVDNGCKFIIELTGEDVASDVVSIMEALPYKASLRAALGVPNLIGTGIGHYTYTGQQTTAQVNATISTANSLLTSDAATPSEIQTSITDLNAITADTEINQPEVGKLYRFKCVGNSSGMRLTSPLNSSSPMQMGDAEGNLQESIFYLAEGNKILSYKEGLYVGLFDGNRLKMFDAGVTGVAATFTDVYDSYKCNPGAYSIRINDVRNIYGKNDLIDSGETLSKNDGYFWTIEEVKWLPISVTNEYSKLGTFVSPVALKAASAGNYAKGGRLKFFTGKIDGDYFRVSEYKEDVIPANTPFLIEYQNGSAYTNSCSYLEISNAEATFSGTNHLQGGLETVPTSTVQEQNQNTTIYTLQKTTEGKQEFRIYTGTNIKGFRAYLPVPNGTLIRGMIFGGQTTDIEVAPTGETAAPIVYDLSGRRVQHATKGMYIVNGKKMYVK